MNEGPVGFVNKGCATPTEATGGAVAAHPSPMGGGRTREGGEKESERKRGRERDRSRGENNGT
eukprot:8806215-Prorocentrum_lima.AAC.1